MDQRVRRPSRSRVTRKCQLHHSLFKSAPIGTFRSTLEGHFIEVNSALVRMLGYPSVEEILALKIPEDVYVDSTQRERLHSTHEASGTLEGVEVLWKKKDGQHIVVNLYARAIHDARGRFLYYEGLVLDVSERKQIMEAMRRETLVSQGQTIVLAQTLQALTTSPQLDTFLNQVLIAIVQQLEATSAIIGLYEVAQDRFVLHMGYLHGKFLSDTELRSLSFLYPPPGHRNLLWRKLIKTHLPVVVEDVQLDPRITYREAWLSQGARALLILPVIVANEVIGWLSLCNVKIRQYSTEEIKLAQALSHQIALAIYLEQLAKQGQQAAVLEERNRLAREIHDTLSQTLTGLKLHLEAATLALPAAPQQAQTRLDEAHALVLESLSEVRRSVFALRPHVLQHEDLSTALARLVTKTATDTQTQITFNLHGDPRSVPAEVENNLLRISQEALHNACVHANARQIMFDLTFGMDEVQMRIKDNGIGFDANESSVDAGFGLTSMRERTERIGGRFSLISQPSQGTEIIIIVPDVRLDISRH